MEIIKCANTAAVIGEFPDGTGTSLRMMPNGQHTVTDVNGNDVSVWTFNEFIYEKSYGDERFTLCSDCGTVIDQFNDWGYVEFNDEILCESCRDRKLDFCERCNRWVEKDTTYPVSTVYGLEQWCPHCVEEFAFICPDCGIKTANDCGRRVIVDEGEILICRNCHINNYRRCELCGEQHRKSDLVRDEVTGNNYCSRCMEHITNDRNRMVRCEHCNATVRNGDTHRVYARRASSGLIERITACNDCYNTTYECALCGRRHIPEDDETEFYLHDGRRICRDCARRRTFECADCGGRYPRSEARNHDNVLYCENCESRHRPVRVITGYHHYSGGSQVWQFRSLEEVNVYKDLFMGIELEIDNGGENHNKAVQITTALGFPAQESNEFKCTTDGSLNDGFEIISMPATYEYHLTKYDWDAGMKKAASLGYSSHDANTCGLHIHVNRSYFDQSIENPETSTVLLMCNNRPWLEKFSRRTRWGYCDFKGDRRTFQSEDFKTANGRNNTTDSVLRSIVSDCHGHGCMVNFGNHATIEFRLFRGTLKHKTFVATLQLVKMMCYAIKHFRKEQLANVDLRWFKKFATNSNYTEFLEYIEERGIMI